jgi:hypothetical protein
MKKPIVLNWTKKAVRNRAEIYAVLANVANLSDLKKWQLEKLLDDAQRNYLDLSKESLREIHPWVYRLINEYLDHNEVDVSEFTKKLARPVKLEKADPSFVIRYDYGTGTELNIKWALGDLWGMLRTWPLPFRRCVICRTVFAAAGKKKYCSQKCTVAAIPSRNDYMRGYMKKRRAREKKRRMRDGN